VAWRDGVWRRSSSTSPARLDGRWQACGAVEALCWRAGPALGASTARRRCLFGAGTPRRRRPVQSVSPRGYNKTSRAGTDHASAARHHLSSWSVASGRHLFLLDRPNRCETLHCPPVACRAPLPLMRAPHAQSTNPFVHAGSGRQVGRYLPTGRSFAFVVAAVCSLLRRSMPRRRVLRGGAAGTRRHISRPACPRAASLALSTTR